MKVANSNFYSELQMSNLQPSKYNLERTVIQDCEDQILRLSEFVYLKRIWLWNNGLRANTYIYSNSKLWVTAGYQFDKIFDIRYQFFGETVDVYNIGHNTGFSICNLCNKLGFFQTQQFLFKNSEVNSPIY